MRLPGLDLLRAIAIVWVMLFHSYLIGGLGDTLGGLDTYGWMGVDLFFVLSGYLIGTQVMKPLAAGRALDLRGFYRRRVFRILPAFFVVLALYAFWPSWRETTGIQPLWQFPTFTFNLLFDHGENYAFSHAWSLCVEEHFYLVFPLATLLLAPRLSGRGFAWLTLAMVVAGMALRAWLWLHYYAPARAANDGSAGLMFLRYIYYPTWSRVDGLLAGVALAACGVWRPHWMAWCHRHGHGVLLAGMALFTLAVLLFAQRTGFAATVFGYPLLSLALALIVAACSGGRAWPARGKLPGAAWLAGISYSLYLSHKGVFHLVDTALDGRLDGHSTARFLVFGIATLIGGALLHYAVERPFLRWRSSGRRAPARSTELPAST